MSEILCLTDEVRAESPFDTFCQYLLSYFDCILCSIKDVREPSDISKIAPKIIVTDSIAAINIANIVKTIFCACVADFECFVKPDTEIRRRFAMCKSIDCFSASRELAKLMYEHYKIKSIIQYPYVNSVPIKSESHYIVYNEDNETVYGLMGELPNEDFVKYDGRQSLMGAKLYLHFPKPTEICNTQIPFASSAGVPTVTCDIGCISEFVGPGDTLLPSNSNLKQWTQGVKIAMRDHNKNVQNVTNSGKRWSNLDALAEKIRQKTIKKREQIAFAPPPVAVDPAEIKRRILAERELQAVQKKKRYTNNKVLQGCYTPISYSREPYVAPHVTERMTPTWFNSIPDGGNIDVSIIVPMYRSSDEIAKQIMSWDLADDGLVKEIIYVDDDCPLASTTVVLSNWQHRYDIEGREKYSFNVGKIVGLSRNSGYATACNAGASYARGKYLLFLNADTTVTPNWISPLHSLLESDPTIGMVGNLQLKDDGGIDSAGSEWMWDNRNFEHIGRNVYQGKRLSKVMMWSEAPDELKIPAERDMVTGCCFMMPKTLFDEIGGFNIEYRIGYWEDSELNMQVKERGYKVYYQPNSIIYHKTGHSRAGLHPFIMDNARLFYERWVNNNKIDNLVMAKRP
jgi:GT2 family glycosyltransferase